MAYNLTYNWQMAQKFNWQLTNKQNLTGNWKMA